MADEENADNNMEGTRKQEDEQASHDRDDGLEKMIIKCHVALSQVRAGNNNNVPF
jgi:hypothetical protein